VLEFIEGLLLSARPPAAAVKVAGFAFKVLMPLNQLGQLPSLGSVVKLYTYLSWKETGPTLFAFLNESDPSLFEQLISVSGVGPKTALSLMGHFSSQQLVDAIQQGDVKALSSVPGIGKKTAERLLVDLKDKTITSNSLALSAALPVKDPLLGDALAALLNLGYPQATARQLVENAFKEVGPAGSLTELLTCALRRR
jgi:Holliday junction DNA helicase RuvA